MKHLLTVLSVVVLFVLAILSACGLDGNPFDTGSSNHINNQTLREHTGQDSMKVIFEVVYYDTITVYDTTFVIDTTYTGIDTIILIDTLYSVDTIHIPDGTVIYDT
jgi:protein-disulfide isomerase-like protein with CxxC motif